MKKILLTILIILISGATFYFFGPYKIKTICFGDLCPQNGGTYIFYRKNYSKEECIQIGAKPIVGIGWVEVYAGCSPF